MPLSIKQKRAAAVIQEGFRTLSDSKLLSGEPLQWDDADSVAIMNFVDTDRVLACATARFGRALLTLRFESWFVTFLHLFFVESQGHSLRFLLSMDISAFEFFILAMCLCPRSCPTCSSIWCPLWVECGFALTLLRTAWFEHFLDPGGFRELYLTDCF